MNIKIRAALKTAGYLAGFASMVFGSAFLLHNYPKGVLYGLIAAAIGWAIYQMYITVLDIEERREKWGKFNKELNSDYKRFEKSREELKDN